MSNLVGDIISAFETRVATILGAGWNELKYKYDIAQNNYKQNKQKYGVIPLSGSTVDGIMTYYTMEQDFRLILTDGFVNDFDDTSLQASVADLTNKLDDIYKDLYSSKLGIPSTVIVVSSFTIEQPEVLDDNNVIVMQADFTIRYRGKLN